MDMLQFAIPTLFGLEKPVADELRRLGMSEVKADNGRVYCQGTERDIPRLNLNLRCGERVLLVLGSFPAPTFDALFEGTRALPWEELIPKGGCFPVKGHCLDSALHAVPPCQAIVKKAVAARLGAVHGLTTLPETGALYQIKFSIYKDTATLMVDTSGAGKDPLCDPFCGSGTIVIEAALIAKNRAPGLNRSFAAQRWSRLDSQLWLDAADEAMDKEFNGSYDIWGGDIDPQAVELSRRNAALAEVDDIVRFQVADAAVFSRTQPYGRIVTNPPYGERIMEKDDAERLYKLFGHAYRQLPEGWRLTLLSSHTEFERTFGRTADKKRKLYNGMLKCDAFFYGK